jgi:hypothetical protein
MGIPNTFSSQFPRIALQKSVTRIGTVTCPVTIGIPVLRDTEQEVRPLISVSYADSSACEADADYTCADQLHTDEE